MAGALGGEIVSADSKQVYRGLPILTDQPSPEMLASVPHHLVGVVPLDEEYSAARFSREAGAAITGIVRRGGVPLLVGGTGLYLRALLGGFSFAGHGGDGSRSKWRDFIREEGVSTAFSELERVDPVTAATIDPQNPRRVARALEAAEAVASGSAKPVSAERDRLWSADSPYRVVSFGLVTPRKDIYRLIEARVDRILVSGAVEEVRAAREGHVSDTASQAIGFSEISDYLDGRKALEEVAASIKQKSRRYAKRQLTWMRKMPDIARIDLAGRSANVTAAAIIEHIHDASA
ncbi:MAG: tRNA (adenosine(37)-N6)-dimethylallyltransferase MiaA [Thermoleophilia bacterium]